MTWLPHATLTPAAETIVDDLRRRLHDRAGLGVTVQGDRVTVRWGRGDKLVQVSMVIAEIDDGRDEPDEVPK